MKNDGRQRGVTTASALLGLFGVSVLAGAGVVYQYDVTAIDRAGNESPRSPAVEASLP